MPFWEGQPTLTAVQWFLRAAVLYLYLVTLAKIMGEREIGKLSLFDFIIGITIGSTVAGALSSSTIGLIGVMISVATLAFFEIILSILSLNFPGFGEWCKMSL